MATTSNPPTVRTRKPSDLDDCVTILHAVYAKDQYPRVPDISYHDFLNSPNIPYAWVAEREVSDVNECGGGVEEDEIIGHVAIGKPSETDLAVMVWRARQRKGAGAGAGDGEVITATLARAAAASSSSTSTSDANSRQKGTFNSRTDEDIDSNGTAGNQVLRGREGDEDGNIAILERLFVHPLARKSGAAAHLVNAAVDFAQHAGTTEQETLDLPQRRASTKPGFGTEAEGGPNGKGIRLLLFVLDANVAAKRLYERLGWEDYGRGVFQWGPGEEEKMGATCFASPLPRQPC